MSDQEDEQGTSSKRPRDSDEDEGPDADADADDVMNDDEDAAEGERGASARPRRKRARVAADADDDDDDEDDEDYAGEKSNEEEEEDVADGQNDEEDEDGDYDGEEDDDDSDFKDDQEAEPAKHSKRKKPRRDNGRSDLVDDVALGEGEDEDEARREDAEYARQLARDRQRERDEEDEEGDEEEDEVRRLNPYQNDDDAFDEMGEDPSLPPSSYKNKKQESFGHLLKKLENIDEDQYEAAQRQRAESIPMEARLPTVTDPKLWLLRVKPGREQGVVMAILQRYFRQKSNGEPFFICSAFTTPASKGYVYVEAVREAHVKQGLQGIQDVFTFGKRTLVPQHEMVQAITVKQNPVHRDLKVGQWVRIKGGLYKGDLARIVALEDQNTEITVKYIPRLDLVGIKRELEEDRRLEEHDLPEEQREKVKLKTGFKGRPPAQLFDADALRNLGAIIDRRREGLGFQQNVHYDVFKGQRFRRGFLYKRLRLPRLVLQDVVPTETELKAFQEQIKDMNDIDEDDEVEDPEKDQLENYVVERKPVKAKFKIGDKVQVVKGDLRNVVGVVTAMNRQGVTVKALDSKLIEEPFSVQYGDLAKYFAVGDHVKVLHGKFKGETGTVVKVQLSRDPEVPATVTVFSDLTYVEMDVVSAELDITNEVNPGKDTLGNYRVYDLVTISRDTVGVIIKIEQRTVKVITNQGSVISVPLQTLGRKRDSKFAVAQDCNQFPIQKDDMVQIVDGANKNRSGTVKHIYRHTLFIHSITNHENSGMMVARSKHCSRKGKSSVSRFDLSSPMAMERQRAPVFTNQRRRKDPFIGRTITITRGRYKGLLGIVKDVSNYSEGQQSAESDLNATLRVELLALSKTASIKRNSVQVKDATGAGVGNVPDLRGPAPATPYIGMQTPRVDHMPATPRVVHTPMTPRTPATPSHRGGDDESASAWQPTTPHHTPRDTNWHSDTPVGLGSMDIDAAQTPNTPNPRTSNPITPNYPAFTPAGAFTPATPDNPITPFTPSTPYDSNVPQTPGTPATPMESVSAAQGLVQWVVPGMHVMHEGHSAVVQSEASGPRALAQIKVMNTVRDVPLDELQAVKPAKDDSVMIMNDATHTKQTGVLIGVDGADGIVKMSEQYGSDIQIFDMKDLVKISAS